MTNKNNQSTKCTFVDIYCKWVHTVMLKIPFSKIALLSKHGQNISPFLSWPQPKSHSSTQNFHEQIIYQIKVYKTIFLPNCKIQFATQRKNVVFIISFLTKKCLNMSKIQSTRWNKNSPFPRAIAEFRVSQESWKFQFAAFFHLRMRRPTTHR